MDNDPHNYPIDTEYGQAERLLERLEFLRDELGTVGEEIISLLRDAGITPPTDPAPDDPEQG